MKYSDPAMEAKHRRRAQIMARSVKEVGVDFFRAKDGYLWLKAGRFNRGTRLPEPQLSLEAEKELICEEFEKMYGITIWDYCQNKEKGRHLYLIK